MALTIELTEQQTQQLESRAKQLNLTLQELVSASIENLLSDDSVPPQGMPFEDAMDYIMEKNRELYRRLA